MPVTFRDSANIERGSIGSQGDVGSFAVVASGVQAFVWEELVKVTTEGEGEVFQATCQALLAPGTDVRRRDVMVARSRRFEVLTVFPGRRLSTGEEKFVHVALREANG